MGFGPAEIGILLIAASFLALPVWAIVDALRASPAAWDAVRQSRTVWIVVVAAGTFTGAVPGIALALVYLLTVRPRLAAAH